MLKKLDDHMVDRGFAEMLGVREYAERMPVWIGNEDNGRLVIRAFNEAGRNETDVDVVDFLLWVGMYRPELLADATLLARGMKPSVTCA